MATLWIREYSAAPAGLFGPGAGSGVPVPPEPGTDQSPLTFSTSAASAAFRDNTKMIAVISSAAFHYVVAASPTATTNAFKVPADTPFFIGGDLAGKKIAAIAAV